MADERLDDDRIRRLYRQAGGSRSTAAHIAEELWVPLASGTLPAPERTAAFDHIVGCETCRQIWRGVSNFDDQARAEGLGPETRSAWRAATPLGATSWTIWRPWAAAAAAVVLITTGFIAGRQTAGPQPVAIVSPPAATPDVAPRDDRAAPPQPAPREPELALHSNIAIIDLLADAPRGADEPPRRVSVAPAVSLVAFVLALNDERAGEYTLEIRRVPGGEVHRVAGLRRTELGTATVGVPRALMPPGRYSLVLRPAGGRGEARYQIEVR